MFVNVTVCRSVCFSTQFSLPRLLGPRVFLVRRRSVNYAVKNRWRRLPHRVLSFTLHTFLLLSSWTLKYHYSSSYARCVSLCSHEEHSLFSYINYGSWFAIECSLSVEFCSNLSKIVLSFKNASCNAVIGLSKIYYLREEVSCSLTSLWSASDYWSLFLLNGTRVVQ